MSPVSGVVVQPSPWPMAWVMVPSASFLSCVIVDPAPRCRHFRISALQTPAGFLGGIRIAWFGLRPAAAAECLGAIRRRPCSSCFKMRGQLVAQDIELRVLHLHVRQKMAMCAF